MTPFAGSPKANLFKVNLAPASTKQVRVRLHLLLISSKVPKVAVKLLRAVSVSDPDVRQNICEVSVLGKHYSV